MSSGITSTAAARQYKHMAASGAVMTDIDFPTVISPLSVRYPRQTIAFNPR